MDVLFLSPFWSQKIAPEIPSLFYESLISSFALCMSVSLLCHPSQISVLCHPLSLLCALLVNFSSAFSLSVSAFMSPVPSLNPLSVWSNSSMQRHTGNILPRIVHKLYCLGRSLAPPQPLSLSLFTAINLKHRKIYEHCPPPSLMSVK